MINIDKLFPATKLILINHGLIMSHNEHLRVPSMGGLDVPSLIDMRNKFRKWTDNSLKDWLKDGWEVQLVKANSDVIQKMVGLPITAETTDILKRAKGTVPSPLIVVTNYTTAGTSSLPITDGYRLLLAVCVGGGGGGSTGTGASGAVAGGGGGGGCSFSSIALAAAGNGTLSIVRGAKGTGVAYNGGSPAEGTDGSDSTISGGPLSSTMTAGGGKKGNSVGSNTGGAGGTSTGGTSNYTGGVGGVGVGSGGTGNAAGGGAAGPTGAGGTGGTYNGAGVAGTGTGGGGGGGTNATGSGAAGGGGCNQPGGHGYNGSDGSAPYAPGAAGGDAHFCAPGSVGQTKYNESAFSAAQGKNGGIGGGGGGSCFNAAGDGGIGTAAIMFAA